MRKLDKYRWRLTIALILVLVFSGLIGMFVTGSSRGTAFFVRDVLVVALVLASLGGFVAHQKHMVE